MLQSAESSAARVKKEFFSLSVPLHKSRGARGGDSSWVLDMMWFIGDQNGKYICSHPPEVGSVGLVWTGSLAFSS